MEPLTTNATVLTVVYSTDSLRHVGGFELGIAPLGIQAAPQPPVEPRTLSRAYGSVRSFVVCASLVRLLKSPRFELQPF
jgi:hypothetical protein